MSRNLNLSTRDVIPELSKEVIETYLSQGLTQSDVAKLYNVTRQAVSWHMKTYGGRMSTRQIVNEAWPWETKAGHDKATPYRRLRDHGEFMKTGGRGMNEDKLARLKKWWKMLRDEDLVVEFDPSIPPIKGVASHGGFAYRPREISDGNLLIRVNEHTTLTKAGAMIWRWPPNIDRLI
ncbi:immunity repressor [Gordonia phage Anon]|nr:immunity repressor [Gordonia phage Anon]